MTAQPYHTTRRVEFHDTDAAGIAHFSAFFRYMEEVEHEFLRHVGLSVMMRDAEGEISWPRVDVQCEYQGAVKFEDVLDIEVKIERLGSRSATYLFDFRHAGRPIATGQMTSVCCRLSPVGPPKSMEIPAAVLEKLKS